MDRDPYPTAELVERLRTLFAGSDKSPPRLQVGGLLIDRRTKRACYGDVSLQLTKTEFGLLYRLAIEPGVLVTRESLRRHVWSKKETVNDHTFDVHINNLRRKLDAAQVKSVVIRVVRAEGYLLEVLPA